ncbi:MAG: carbamoyltransferase HypF [Desulfobacterales bacterium]|nr:carbamoyltransferase HypF [Desulfobacterales bacterium]
MTGAKDALEARRVEINGIVQGVGFRPFVFSLARKHRLCGEVANTADGVWVHVQGDSRALDRFVDEIPKKCPPLAQITHLVTTPRPAGPYPDFTISPSRTAQGHTTLISPDVSVCADCLGELFDPGDRRYRYPFINCTNCGPRYTIIDDIPYDRPYTSMRHFTMCPQCQAEYDDPCDRRFHAQPNACPACGPQVQLCDTNGDMVDCVDPIGRAAELVRQGKVLAVKGLGGFHLAVDAENDAAVECLRERKGREEKPFALMAADLERIGRFAEVGDAEAAILTTIQRPIVLLRQKPGQRISGRVAPGNRYFGVMLPYAPLHYLLLEGDFAALVMTSGNLSEEPICIDNAEAFERLAGIADAFLVHNRDIYLRSDDTIVRHVAGTMRQIRRSRGFVPVPLFLRESQPSVLACGAELKNTVCLTREDRAFVSQHIGDLENTAALDFFELTVAHMQRILNVTPEIVACDLHPDYLSTRYAETLDLKRIAVQHHHAHIISCLAENRADGAVIGLAFDGTGYGTDGTVWGGEVLLADAAQFSRVAHLETLPMPGSAAAIRQPWRMAVSSLYHVYGNDFFGLDLPFLRQIDDRKIRIVTDMMRTGLNSPLTSSLGRLFDAVAALCGIRERVSFEGQAAMELEMMAAGQACGIYDFEWGNGADRPIFLAPIISGVVADIQCRRPLPEISRRFHDTLIVLFTRLCVELRAEHGLDRVALSGGVFQNAILLTGMIHSLEKEGFDVLSHRLVPANDGGIALGQAVAAAAMAAR